MSYIASFSPEEWADQVMQMTDQRFDIAMSILSAAMLTAFSWWYNDLEFGIKIIVTFAGLLFGSFLLLSSFSIRNLDYAMHKSLKFSGNLAFAAIFNMMMRYGEGKEIDFWFHILIFVSITLIVMIFNASREKRHHA